MTVGTPVPVSSPSPNGNLQFYFEQGSNTVPQSFWLQQEFYGRRAGSLVEESAPSSYVQWLVTVPNVNVNSVFGTVAVYPPGTPQPTSYMLSLGHQQIDFPGPPGLAITITGTGPSAIKGYGGGGYLAISQIVNDSYITNPSQQFPEADGCPLMDYAAGPGATALPVPQTNYRVAAGATPYPSPFVDSPGLYLGDLTPPEFSPESVSDSFTDYFMFRPFGTNANWVSLGYQPWTWAGTAVYAHGAHPPWTIQPGSVIQPPQDGYVPSGLTPTYSNSGSWDSACNVPTS
jgi:hypothetical protein